jgi:hypothetical protein
VSPIIGDLARQVPGLSGSSVSMNKDTDQSTALIAEELKSLVLISLSSTWASGVIISPLGCTLSSLCLGFICLTFYILDVITSGHVFKSLIEEKSPSLQPRLKDSTPPIRIRLHGQFDEW